MFGVGIIHGVVRSRRTFIGVIRGVSMSRVLGIVRRVNMSRFMNGDLSMGWYVIRAEAVNKGIELIIVGRVIRAGAVNKGVVGHVIMSGVLGIVRRVSMSGFVNGDVSMGVELIVVGRVNKSCGSTKNSVVVVLVGRSVVW